MATSVLLSVRKMYIKVFARGTENPSAKVAELINSEEHGKKEDLITQANDTLYGPLAVATYNGASKHEVEMAIKVARATFERWMDIARSSVKDQVTVDVEKLSADELEGLRDRIDALLNQEKASAVDEDDFS